MSAHGYHTRPMLALAYAAYAVFRGTNAETAINFVGGLKTHEANKQAAATREARRRKRNRRRA